MSKAILSRTGLALTLVLCGGLGVSAWAREDEPISVLARVTTSGTLYVGQALTLEVREVAAGERPEVRLPPVPGAEVVPVATAIRPLTMSGIGDVISETNLFVHLYRVIPRRAGDLILPPARVTVGERSGASRPLRLTIRPVPTVGRPSTFLGGVGPLEVDAQARPDRLKLGESLEYRVVLTGPGAWGSTQQLSLPDLDSLGLGLRVEPMPTESGTRPPSRTFRFRIRPTRPGEATLPPPRVSYFDPQFGRYQTKVGPGVRLQVADVPDFDPILGLSYGESASPSTPSRIAAPAFGRWVLGILALIFMTISMGWVWVRIPKGWNSPQRFARRAARDLDSRLGPEPLARRITEDLTEYLRLATGRPPGALTPTEARREFLRASGGPALAERVERLLAACDHVCYSGSPERAEALQVDARDIFRTLHRMRLSDRDAENTERGIASRVM